MSSFSFFVFFFALILALNILEQIHFFFFFQFHFGNYFNGLYRNLFKEIYHNSLEVLGLILFFPENILLC